MSGHAGQELGPGHVWHGVIGQHGVIGVAIVETGQPVAAGADGNNLESATDQSAG